MTSTSRLETYLQNRSVCQEGLNRIPTLLNRRRIVLNTLSSQGGLHPFSVLPRRRFNKFIGVAIRGRDRIIRQSQHMVTTAHTPLNLFGIRTYMPGIRTMETSDPIQAVEEAPMQLLGLSIPQPRILNIQAMFNTIITTATTAT